MYVDDIVDDNREIFGAFEIKRIDIKANNALASEDVHDLREL